MHLLTEPTLLCAVISPAIKRNDVLCIIQRSYRCKILEMNVHKRESTLRGETLKGVKSPYVTLRLHIRKSVTPRGELNPYQINRGISLGDRSACL